MRQHHRAGLTLLCLVVFCLAALIGCLGVELIAQPVSIPTVEAEATLPSAQVGTAVPIPPTFTPAAPLVDSALPSSTPVLTPTPIWTLETAELSPQLTRPFVTLPANAPFVSTMPQSRACSEAGYLFRTQFPSDVGGPTRFVHIYLPPCYGQDAHVYPVLYLFHGSIQNDTHWSDLGLVDVMNERIQAGAFPPFIVVMPDNGTIGNNTSGNAHSIEGITLNALMPFIEANFCTWNAREGRSLGGISRGGYWALMIAFRHTDLFGSVSGHSSQLRLDVDNETYNPLVTYADADLSDTRIWLDWGEEDFLQNGQQSLRRSLTAVGIEVDGAINPGGHNERYWLLYLPEYLTWHAAAWPLDRSQYPTC